MKSRIVLFADEGKVLTNGETYGTHIYLGVQDNPENWHEITKEEYDKIAIHEEQSI